MKIREHIHKLRVDLGKLFKYSVYDAAACNKLAIEYWDGMPTHYDGHLDTTNEQPRFIAVNPDLPKLDQVFVIAREIGRYAQLRGIDSPFIDRPWKSNLLPTAPPETRDLIYKLDLEVRTYWILYWHGGKREYFDLIKRFPNKYNVILFSSNISDYIFWKLRVRNFFTNLLSIFRLIKRKPSVQSFNRES